MFHLNTLPFTAIFFQDELNRSQRDVVYKVIFHSFLFAVLYIANGFIATSQHTEEICLRRWMLQSVPQHIPLDKH